MSLYVEFDISVGVFTDSTKDTTRFGLRVSPRSLDQYVGESSSVIALASGASNVAVSLQGLTNGQLVVLKSAGAFDVKFNGSGNPAVSLKPRTNTTDSKVTPAFLIMSTDGITSLFLSNSGAQTVVVEVGVAGT